MFKHRYDGRKKSILVLGAEIWALREFPIAAPHVELSYVIRITWEPPISD